MKITDLIKDNAPDTWVIIRGKNPIDDCDGLCKDYYEGLLKDIPEDLHQSDVLHTAWSVANHCHLVVVPLARGDF